MEWGIQRSGEEAAGPYEHLIVFKLGLIAIVLSFRGEDLPLPAFKQPCWLESAVESGFSSD